MSGSDILSRALHVSGAMLGAAFWTGCASGATAVFRPMEQATAVEHGQIAARYAIPPEAPRGDVRVASLGVAKVPDSGGRRRPAVSVRLVVSNDDGESPWSVPVEDIRLEHPSAGLLAPTAVRVSRRSHEDPAGDGAVMIGRGEAREIDLHYHLPRGHDPADLHRFDLLWSLQTDARAVSERTPFERVEDVASRPVAARAGYGPMSWYGYGPYLGPSPYYVYQPRPIAGPVLAPRPLVRPLPAPLPRIPASPGLFRHRPR